MYANTVFLNREIIYIYYLSIVNFKKFIKDTFKLQEFIIYSKK